MAIWHLDFHQRKECKDFLTMLTHNGCDYDILFNSKKSQLMIFDTMKQGYDRHII